jgi:hypothetical protein
MKFRINQDKNKIAKSTLAIVLAGSFAFSPTFTFAAQESDEEGAKQQHGSSNGNAQEKGKKDHENK